MSSLSFSVIPDFRQPKQTIFDLDLTHYSPVFLFYTPWKHQKTNHKTLQSILHVMA